MTLEKAIRAVVLGTVAAGVVGGVLGAVLGQLAPSFFGPTGIGAPGTPGESGLALGAIAGFILGAVGCVILAAARMLADARIEAARARDAEDAP